MHEVIRKAKEAGCKYTAFDLDNSAVKKCHGFSEAIGVGFLKREMKNLSTSNASSVLHGLWNYAKIKAHIRFNNKDNGAHSRGLEILFDSLGKSEVADRDDAYRFARIHRDKNEIYGFGGFARECSEVIGPVVITTVGPDIGADVIRRKYPDVIAGHSANPVIYRWDGKKFSNEPVVYLEDGKMKGEVNWREKNPIICGCDMQIKTPEDKGRMTDKLLEKLFDSGLEEAFTIFDDPKLDSYIAENSLFAAASPPASKEAIAKANYNHIKSYVV
jgi:hypothetical protein